MALILTLASWSLGARRRVLPVGLEENWDRGSGSQGTSSPILMDAARGGARAMAVTVRIPVSCSPS